MFDLNSTIHVPVFLQTTYTYSGLLLNRHILYVCVSDTVTTHICILTSNAFYFPVRLIIIVASLSKDYYCSAV